MTFWVVECTRAEKHSIPREMQQQLEAVLSSNGSTKVNKSGMFNIERMNQNTKGSAGWPLLPLKTPGKTEN